LPATSSTRIFNSRILSLMAFSKVTGSSIIYQAPLAGTTPVFTILARDANDNPLSSPISPALTISVVRQDTSEALEFTASEVAGVNGAVRVSYTAPASDAGYSVVITVLIGGATTTLKSTAAVAVRPDRHCPLLRIMERRLTQ